MPFNSREQAAIEGQTTYVGRNCAKCGGVTRYVSNGGCVACARKRAKRHDDHIRDLRRQARGNQA